MNCLIVEIYLNLNVLAPTGLSGLNHKQCGTPALKQKTGKLMAFLFQETLGKMIKKREREAAGNYQNNCHHHGSLDINPYVFWPGQHRFVILDFSLNKRRIGIGALMR